MPITIGPGITAGPGVRIGGEIITATGGTISTYTSGGITYRLHTFTSSGTFGVSAGGGSVDYLIVGGGGGGGYLEAGGGGGGYVLSGSQSVSITNYTVTVGTGGAGKNVKSL